MGLCPNHWCQRSWTWPVLWRRITHTRTPKKIHQKIPTKVGNYPSVTQSTSLLTWASQWSFSISTTKIFQRVSYWISSWCPFYSARQVKLFSSFQNRKGTFLTKCIEAETLFLKNYSIKLNWITYACHIPAAIWGVFPMKWTYAMLFAKNH